MPEGFKTGVDKHDCAIDNLAGPIEPSRERSFAVNVMKKSPVPQRHQSPDSPGVPPRRGFSWTAVLALPLAKCLRRVDLRMLDIERVAALHIIVASCGPRTNGPAVD
jgi:hypothetical protein